MNPVDRKFMTQALKLAQKGGRAVAPNPMVGAVIVKHGKVIGKGYHQIFGGPHAEVNAIASVKHKEDLKEATMYVTLEPCRHHGKTPPCLELIESVGIKEVFYGSEDPFVSDKREAESGKPNTKKLITYRLSLTAFLDNDCHALNKFFFTWVTKKRPFITAKIAVSADGFVAGKNGQPVHLTSKMQDRFVHQLRAQHQAIMVGSNTVLMDNPHLGVRHVVGHDPLRIILDSGKKLPKDAKVFRDNNVYHVQKRVKLSTLFKTLAKKGITSVLVEPGPTLYRLLKKEGLIDELIVLRGRKKLGEGVKMVF